MQYFMQLLISGLAIGAIYGLIAMGFAVIYKSTGVASTSPLIAYIDFGGDQTVNAGNFSIVFAATGVLTATAS